MAARSTWWSLLWVPLWHWPALAVSRMGSRIVSLWQGTAYIVAVICAVLALAVRPRSWPRTVRAVFVRQVLYTTIDGLAVALRVGMAVGILLIVEAAMWLETVGSTTEVVAPSLLAITVRELGPLIACLVAIGRSGVAMATEMANMKVHGELDVLESQGIDIMNYLVMPRVLSMMFSVFSLALVIVAAIFLAGYTVGLVTGDIHAPPHEFFDSIFSKMKLTDLWFFLPKTLLSGLLMGTVCCLEGLHVRPLATEVPRIASRSGVHALTAVFMINAIVSLIIYGRVLIFQVL